MRSPSDLAPEERAALLLRKYRPALEQFRPYAEARLYAILADNVTLASIVVLRDGAVEPERWALMMGQGLTGMTAITGVPNLFHDAHRHPRSIYRDPTLYQEAGDQVMVAPIKEAGADPAAVLFLNRMGRSWWTAQEYALFLTLAEQITQDWFKQTGPADPKQWDARR